MRGGVVPLVVEVREQVSERGVFWTERLLIGVAGLTLLDTKQLGEGAYDPATQEMVYRVLAPWWVKGSMSQWGNGTTVDTFIWTQAQWVGVPLLDKEGPGEVGYREGNANDAVPFPPSGVVPLQPCAKKRSGGGRRRGARPKANAAAKRARLPGPSRAPLSNAPGLREDPMRRWWCNGCPM